RRRVGSGERAGLDAQGQGRVRPRAPVRTWPFRRRDLMSAFAAPPPPGGPAFDDDHPPSQELLDDCVHCGFCLATCPTYVLWGEEMDSPRGRILLVEHGLRGEEMTDSMVGHIDNCLGCMACVTACPSGVQYDRILEPTRAQIERRHERSRADRLLREAIFALF